MPCRYYGDGFVPHWLGHEKCADNKNVDGVLPSLIILGVHKGGSTLLFSLLSDHGAVRPAYCKELHFFDVHFKTVSRRSMHAANITKAVTNVYRKYFRSVKDGQPMFHTIEATPSYFTMPLQIAMRIRSLLPSIKLAVTLRNPVHRSISHFIGQRKSAEFVAFESCDAWFKHYRKPALVCDPLRPGRRYNETGDLARRNNEYRSWRKGWDAYVYLPCRTAFCVFCGFARYWMPGASCGATCIQVNLVGLRVVGVDRRSLAKQPNH